MSEANLPLDYIPEDGLREVLEEEERLYRRMKRGYRKRPYPSNRDIADAIREVIARHMVEHPDDFPEAVLEVLEERGFETRHVTIKRIWRMYETLVRKGVISDTLGVVVW